MPDMNTVDPMTCELEGLSLMELDTLRQRIMGGKEFDELTEAQIERWIAVNNRCRQAGRTASKPAGNGGPKTKRVAADTNIDDLLGGMDL